MLALRNLFQFYINSSIHTALSTTALTKITAIHFGFSSDLNLLLFVFFGTITGYNFVKFAGIARFHHRRLTKNLKMIQFFSLLCFVAFAYYMLKVKVEVLFVAAFFGIFTLLYVLPVFGKDRNLRNVPGIKVFIIALIWAGVSVLFPVVNANISLDINVAVEFFQRFIFVLVLILPFEIRDLKYDVANLQTIPQKIGVKRSKILGLVLLSIFILAENIKETATIASISGVYTVGLITGGFILKTEEKQTAYFASFWIEGIPVLWLAAISFITHF